MKSVIINADDFGLSPGVSRGILSAFRDGILTSTTMLVNLPSFDDAAALARQNPDLPVGIHLSLLWGEPVTDPARIPTLVDGNGELPRSLTTLARRYYLGRIATDQVKTEFRNQIRKFVETGLAPTHLDTHKHVHCLPGIMEALIAVAGELGIGKLRLPYEDGLEAKGGAAPPRPGFKAAGKRNLIRFLCRASRDRLRRAGIKTTDHFAGIDYMDHLDADVLRRILGRLRSGVTEVMCHPGYFDRTARALSGVPPHRERELEGLKDAALKDFVASQAIRLTHYGEL